MLPPILNKIFIYRKKLIQPYIDKLLGLTTVLSYIMSMLLIVTLIFENGFVVTQEDLFIISRIYSYTWITFLVNAILHLTLDFQESRKEYGKMAWVMTALLFLTLIPVVVAAPAQDGVLSVVWHVLHNKLYLVSVLALLSLMQISNGVVLMLGKRIKPSFIFAISFLVIIFVGAGLLMLPRATYESISFVDALFTSTSATCVTGLTTVDVASTFTPMGLFFIMVLIQVGGLGVMTLTSFFAVFFMGNASIYNQTMMCDMVSSKSLNSLFSTLIYIFGFTIMIELIGAGILFVNIHDTLGMTLNEEIAFAVFHSISAFCNAGFSTLPNNLGNEMLLGGGHNMLYFTISVLVILGGIGFPILVNLYDSLKYRLSRFRERYILRTKRVGRQVHLYDINTRIAIIMTVVLLVVGTIVIGAIEWNGAFAGMPILDRVTQSFFTATCPRTAGFASVSMTSFSVQTLLLMILLMVIGGGTQSTAGGLKVNVFAVILLNLRAIIFGLDRVTVFNRELSQDSIRRSNSTLVLYLIFVFVAFYTLTILEPEASLMALIFETISALSTVGSSLDLTPMLGTASKFIIIALMFIGRIGVLTLMASIVRQSRVQKCKYPSGNIIIN